MVGEPRQIVTDFVEEFMLGYSANVSIRQRVVQVFTFDYIAEHKRENRTIFEKHRCEDHVLFEDNRLTWLNLVA